MKTLVTLIFSSFLINTLAFAQYSKDQSVKLNVTVTDYDNKPRKGDQILFENISTKEVHKGITNDKGKFSLMLIGGNSFLIKIKGLGEEVDYKQIDLEKVPEGYIGTSMQLTIQIDEGSKKTYTLNNVHFVSNKATLTTSSYAELSDLIEYMKLKESVIIEIAGHTDNVGDDHYNLILSQKRAESVKRYLVEKGVSANRIVAKGYGETQPIDNNNTPEGRQNNRRSEVKILKE